MAIDMADLLADLHEVGGRYREDRIASCFLNSMADLAYWIID
jgi:hypothetical protein